MIDRDEQVIFAGGHTIEVEETSAEFVIPLGSRVRARTLGVEVSVTRMSGELGLVLGTAGYSVVGLCIWRGSIGKSA